MCVIIVFNRRRTICIANIARWLSSCQAWVNKRLIRQDDGPAAGQRVHSQRFLAKTRESERTEPTRASLLVISAVAIWANRWVRLSLRQKCCAILHASERPLNSSEVARAAGLHRGTAYNILRTLQAEGFVGYDEATRSYSVSLHILELAYGVLRRSGLMDLARPLMHAVSDAHGVSVYLSKVLGPSSLLLLDWVGVLRSARTCTSPWGGPSPVPAGASGVIIAAFGNSSEPELEALFSKVAWYQKPSFSDFLARVREAKKCRFRGRSRRDVSGDYADLRAGSVAVMGAAADPDRGWTFA